MNAEEWLLKVNDWERVLQAVDIEDLATATGSRIEIGR